MFWRDLMAMDLEERIVLKEDGSSWKNYSVVLAYDQMYISFRDQYSALPGIRFKCPEQEAAVLSFYRDAPCRLPITNAEILPNVFRFKDELYARGVTDQLSNQNDSSRITIVLAKRIDLLYYQSLAVKNLLSAVQDEDLSLGDRMMVRDIALKAFHHALGLAMEPDRKYIFSFCFNRLNVNEAALAELERYGFTAKSEKVVKVG